MLIPMIIYGAVGGLLGMALAFFRSRNAVKRATPMSQGAAYGAFAGAFLYLAAGGSYPAAMNQSTGNVRKITDSEYDAEVAKDRLPVVMDFYATWCGPCKQLAPVMDGLADEFKGKIKFVKVNVDDSPVLARRFEVSGIPALIFIKNEKMENTVVGLTSTESLRNHLREFSAQTTTAKAVPATTK
jgi:thioredoxin 1